MNTDSIKNSGQAPDPFGLYPHGRRTGNLLFLSRCRSEGERHRKSPRDGVLDTNGLVRSYDIVAQCQSIFKNVRLSVRRWFLMDQLVDVTVFLTNMKDDFKAYNEIYAEYFKDNQSCRTTVEINCLPTPIAIELKCVAIID